MENYRIYTIIVLGVVVFSMMIIVWGSFVFLKDTFCNKKPVRILRPSAGQQGTSAGGSSGDQNTVDPSKESDQIDRKSKGDVAAANYATDKKDK